MKRKVVVGILTLAFVFGVIVGNTLRSPSVAAVGSSVQSWGVVPLVLDDSATGSAENLLVLYDSSNGEIWGYRVQGPGRTLGREPIRIGKLTKVGTPIVK